MVLISDSEFLEGQVAIETAAANEHMPAPVVESIELLAFRNNSSESVYSDREMSTYKS